jgi:osmotically-inducible protein OsmY
VTAINDCRCIVHFHLLTETYPLARLALLLMALAGCGGSPQDETIARAVKSSMMNDPSANLQRVEVFVDHGMVYLDGEVEDKEQKDRAATIASQVSGVTQLVNKLHVIP